MLDSGHMIMVFYPDVRSRLVSIEPWTLCETYVLGIHGDFVAEGMIVLDIGAQAGDTALYYASGGENLVGGKAWSAFKRQGFV